MIIRAISKSREKVVVKYTVYFWDGRCLTLSSNPNTPQGVSQWSEYFGINDDVLETGIIGNEKMMNWYDLPVVIQAHVEKQVNQAQGQ